MSLSPIERLPAELIQPIFFYSDLNLALPAASPHLASKLANEYYYHAVCTRYLTTNLDSRVEQTSAQTRIFSYKWMTWDFFKSFVLKKWGISGCLCGKTPEEGCCDPQWPPDFEDATTMLFSRSHLPALSYIKCRIPVKLLGGPWTTDKIQFLRFILWTTSMTVDWGSHEARKTAREGKKEALLKGNLEVVELFNHNRRLGKAPNLDTVRFAVIEGGCDRSIVYDTMATARTWGLRGEAWNCGVLDQWCESKIQEGDPKGKWLQLKLQELRVTHGAGDLHSGYMHPETGNYGDVEGDSLVITPHKWNQSRRGIRTVYHTETGAKRESRRWLRMVARNISSYTLSTRVAMYSTVYQQEYENLSKGLLSPFGGDPGYYDRMAHGFRSKTSLLCPNTEDRGFTLTGIRGMLNINTMSFLCGYGFDWEYVEKSLFEDS